MSMAPAISDQKFMRKIGFSEDQILPQNEMSKILKCSLVIKKTKQNNL